MGPVRPMKFTVMAGTSPSQSMESIWLGGNASELWTRKRTASRAAEVKPPGTLALVEHPQQQAHGLEEFEAAGMFLAGRAALRPGRRPAASDQDFLSRSGGPFADHLLPLPGSGAELGEAVERRVESQEMLDHAGKQVDAAAHELLLVEFEFDAGSARERHAVLGDDGGEVRPALQIGDPFDHLLREWRNR